MGSLTYIVYVGKANRYGHGNTVEFFIIAAA